MTSNMEREAAELVNKARAREGLSPLRLDERLSNIARHKSQDMKDRQYFSHDSPVYGSPFEMLTSFGVHYRRAGENIAKGQQTADRVVNAWLKSPGHRDNILDPTFNKIGMGLVWDKQGNSYWTQLFVN